MSYTPLEKKRRMSIFDLAPKAAREELVRQVEEWSLPGYRVDQIHRRLWTTPIASWEEATELPVTLRAVLEEHEPIPRLMLHTDRTSRDGTRKFLWQLHDGQTIESVLIPSGRRRTLCISSQAGCALGCLFCATGRMGFQRNLSAWEIAGQLRELVLLDPGLAPTNVVFMGMGEPLLNWDAVDPTLSILNDPTGFGIGARHITVSTVGILPGMEALSRRKEQFRLALSLHSARSDERLALMPIERKYPLASLLEAASQFARRVTLEYVLISGRNDARDDAAALSTVARRLGALVNLLPLHPGGGPGLRPTPNRQIAAFAEELSSRGVEVAIRKSRGLDIEAACGQLRTVVSRSERGLARHRVSETT